MGKFDFDKMDREFGSRKSRRAQPEAEKAVPAVKQAVQPAPKASAGKMPMMNIRFSPENYDYMRREAAMRGISVIALTNWIIDEYRSDPSHVHANAVYRQEENW